MRGVMLTVSLERFQMDRARTSKAMASRLSHPIKTLTIALQMKKRAKGRVPVLRGREVSRYSTRTPLELQTK
jgi:hypothetical protein